MKEPLMTEKEWRELYRLLTMAVWWGGLPEHALKDWEYLCHAKLATSHVLIQDFGVNHKDIEAIEQAVDKQHETRTHAKNKTP